MSQIDTTVLDKLHESTDMLRDPYAMQNMYMRFINDELKELEDAHYKGNALKCLKKSLDVIEVAYGYAKASAAFLGMPVKPFWDELDRGTHVDE